ncbi:hypothetical protein [Pseudopedobacter beijingensis]|uniref:DKNYY family protein n=1 Tax=Pseudopedobacter beijingensis TaxID=1207056 RepID=A0ABW4IHY8_9SPHI
MMIWKKNQDFLFKSFGIKVSDARYLRRVQFFHKDAANRSYYWGDRKGKFWWGVYDTEGNEMYQQTVMDDPEVIELTGGGKYPLNSSIIHFAADYDGIIYFSRTIRRGGDLLNEDAPFLQSITYYDWNDRSTGEIVLNSETDSRNYLEHLYKWDNNRLITKRFKLEVKYMGKEYDLCILSKHLALIEVVKQADYPNLNIPEYHTPFFGVSDYDYLVCEGLNIKRKSIKNSNKIEWSDYAYYRDYGRSDTLKTLAFYQSGNKAVHTFEVRGDGKVTYDTLYWDIATGRRL